MNDERTGPVAQMIWDKSNPRRWVWIGPGALTITDVQEAEIAGAEWYDPNAGQKPRKGGGAFFQKGGTDRMVRERGQDYAQKGSEFPFEQGTDISSYFGGDLQIAHRGPGITPQSTGAMFPSAPVQQPPQPLAPQSSMAWLQDASGQTTERRPEATIMGGSARDFMSGFGFPDTPGAPWAHIRPDHSRPPDREVTSLRHPATLGANQQHSAFEWATEQLREAYGAQVVGRRLNDPLGDGSGMFASMTFQFILPTAFGFRRVESTVPYFGHRGARYGDAQAIYDYLEREILRLAAIDSGTDMFGNLVSSPFGFGGFEDEDDDFNGGGNLKPMDQSD